MIRSPLVPAELTHLSRSPRTWILRAGLALFFASAVALAWPWSGQAADFHHAGKVLWLVFFWSGIAAGVVLVPAVVAPAISWERERGTLDLLVVAPVTDLEIVGGKLFAHGALVAATLAAAFPVGIAALLVGGTTPVHLLAVTVALILHALFAASVAILVSASGDKAGPAAALTIIAVMLVIFGSAVVAGILVSIFRPAGREATLVLAAAVCPWSAAVGDAVGGGSTWAARAAAWTSHAVAIAVALVLAGRALRGTRSPGTPMFSFRSAPDVPVAALAPRSGPPMAFFPPSPSPVFLQVPAWAPVLKSHALPVRGNPLYWKVRAFEESAVRQAIVIFGALACGLLFMVDAAGSMLMFAADKNTAPLHFALVGSLAVCVFLAVSAGAGMLGPDGERGTLPVLLSTGMPASAILRGRLLAALRSVAVPSAIAGVHLLLASFLLGASGAAVFLSVAAGCVFAFSLAAAMTFVAGGPRSAAAATFGTLFLLWGIPSLAALPFPGHAVVLTSLNPAGILVRAVAARAEFARPPDAIAAVLFMVFSLAAAAAASAAAARAIEARVRS